MSEGFLLRVKYVKRGRLAYLSHLETIRSMERVIRRAGLPYAVTEGFNPHMKVAFGPALPVGAGGEGEYLDVRLREYLAADRALAQMQAASAPNLRPISCEYLDVRCQAISVAYPVSLWRACFAPAADADALARAFEALVARGYIEVVRKKGKPKLVAFEGRLEEKPRFVRNGDRVCMEFRTRDCGQGALRPDKFIAAALEGIEAPPPLVSLTRLELQP